MKVLQKEKKEENKKLYQVEYKHVRVLRFFYIILAFFLFGGFLAIGYFVYTNIFHSLEQVNTIAILKSELDLKTINIPRLTAVENIWEEKTTQTQEKTTIPNPFDIPKETPITTNTSTEPISSSTEPTATIELAPPIIGDLPQNTL